MAQTMTWGPSGDERRLLGVIQGPKGLRLNPQQHRLQLEVRLKKLAEKADDQELKQVESLLHQAGLLEVPLERDEVPLLLLAENPVVKDLLEKRRVPGPGLPKVLEKNDPKAEEVYNQASLLQWIQPLLRGRLEHD